MPRKFHMGCYPAFFISRWVTVAFVLPCEPSKDYPGNVAVFETREEAESFLAIWSEVFDQCQSDRSEFVGSF